MKKYALVGHSLAHTLSPLIHKSLFALSGVEAEYSVFDCANVADRLAEISTLDGYNVTIPHKIDIIKYLTSVDKNSEIYHSVNVVDKNNVGYNTDCYGFSRAITELGASLASRVLLLGYGGVGRMMAREIILSGGQLTLMVRENVSDIAEDLKEFAGVKVVNFGDNIGEFDLIVNSTPVGMYPNISACPIQKSVIARTKYIFDAIYNPVKTPLIFEGEALGKVCGSGMSMLVYQAIKAHEIWYGGHFSEQQIAELIDKCNDTLK